MRPQGAERRGSAPEQQPPAPAQRAPAPGRRLPAAAGTACCSRRRYGPSPVCGPWCREFQPTSVAQSVTTTAPCLAVARGSASQARVPQPSSCSRRASDELWASPAPPPADRERHRPVVAEMQHSPLVRAAAWPLAPAAALPPAAGPPAARAAAEPPARTPAPAPAEPRASSGRRPRRKVHASGLHGAAAEAPAAPEAATAELQAAALLAPPARPGKETTPWPLRARPPARPPRARAPRAASSASRRVTLASQSGKGPSATAPAARRRASRPAKRAGSAASRSGRGPPATAPGARGRASRPATRAGSTGTHPLPARRRRTARPGARRRGRHRGGGSRHARPNSRKAQRSESPPLPRPASAPRPP